jgi:putative flippase GtrA
MRHAAAQLARYFVTGGIAAIVDVGGFALLLGLAVPIAPAATLSFCAAVVVNYLLSARFVFFAQPSLRGFGLFVLGALAGAAINIGITVLLSHLAGLHPVLAKVGGVGVAFIINFLINRLIVFRART